LILSALHGLREKVGLGLSLLAQAARETGGDILIQSVPDKGTLVRADFRPRHIDMKPLGNITDTVLTLIAGNPRVDFLFSYIREGKSYCLEHAADTIYPGRGTDKLLRSPVGNQKRPV